jgi:phospholipid/cholesterol/gamma-HCH transport system permease protein
MVTESGKSHLERYSGEFGAAFASPPGFSVAGGLANVTAALVGDWTLSVADRAGQDLRAALQGAQRLRLDLTQMGRLDTAGALSVLGAAGDRLDLSTVQGRPELTRLLDLVSRAAGQRAPEVRRPHDLHALVISVGRGAVGLWSEVGATLAFAHHVTVGLITSLAHPQRFRWAAWTTQVERAGLDAIPIVATTSFFIGAVVGLLGVHMLQRFGAQVFVVELIGVAVLREFAVIITAVLLAGRSASAFAAELGSMRMQQEIDALRVLGVDPIEALVLPRLGGLIITMPLLTFVAVLSGLLGGMLITWSTLGLAPAFFLQRIVDNVGVTHLWVGLSKAPIMAAVIAGIGCRQGLEVGGDVQSLGRRVTAAVVHAIFAIIMIDAAFALAYMELNI